MLAISPVNFQPETGFGFVVQIKWTVCSHSWEMFPFFVFDGDIFQVYSLEHSTA